MKNLGVHLDHGPRGLYPWSLDSPFCRSEKPHLQHLLELRKGSLSPLLASKSTQSRDPLTRPGIPTWGHPRTKTPSFRERGGNRVRYLLSLGTPSHRTGRADPQQQVLDRAPHNPSTHPSGHPGTHTSLAGSARPSTTRILSEPLLAMAYSPKLSRQGVYRGSEAGPGGDLHVISCEPNTLSAGSHESGSRV